MMEMVCRSRKRIRFSGSWEQPDWSENSIFWMEAKSFNRDRRPVWQTTSKPMQRNLICIYQILFIPTLICLCKWVIKSREKNKVLKILDVTETLRMPATVSLRSGKCLYSLLCQREHLYWKENYRESWRVSQILITGVTGKSSWQQDARQKEDEEMVELGGKIWSERRKNNLDGEVWWRRVSSWSDMHLEPVLSF
jgi:hypothetical protein